jgi:hypothetical protein
MIIIRYVDTIIDDRASLRRMSCESTVTFAHPLDLIHSNMVDLCTSKLNGCEDLDTGRDEEEFLNGARKIEFTSRDKEQSRDNR